MFSLPWATCRTPSTPPFFDGGADPALLCLYVIIEDGVKDWFDMALVGTFGAIALLFNPILPVYLSRQVWRLPDLMAGVLFILSRTFSFASRPCLRVARD